VWRHPRTELTSLGDLRFHEESNTYLAHREASPNDSTTQRGLGSDYKLSVKVRVHGNREEATGLRTSAAQVLVGGLEIIDREGSGYWQYIRHENGVRFLTWYDYRTRFGAMGRLLDQYCSAVAWGGYRLEFRRLTPPRIDRGLNQKSLFDCQLFTHVRVWANRNHLVVAGASAETAYLTMPDERAMMAASHLSTALVR